MSEPPRVAVVGHVEWVHFVRVDRVPRPGEIVHAVESWEEAAGGGAVAAVQLAKLAGHVSFFTAFGDDHLGRRAYDELRARGLHVEGSFRPTAQRRAITHIDAQGERTITVLGERLGPEGSDPLAWGRLEQADAVYFTHGDVSALWRARRAKVLVATSRVLPTLARARVALDCLVGSAADAAETYRTGDLDPPPRIVVRTAGPAGGTWQADGRKPTVYRAAPVPGPAVDTYGCGDSFAAGLTYALGSGYSPAAAVRLAARCGAAALSGRGPYPGQLRSAGTEAS